MDHEELDALARRLAQPATRRTGLAALLAGLVGLTAFAGETDAGKRPGRRKRKNRPSTHRCTTSADCPVKGQDCIAYACTCVWDMKPQAACNGACCKNGQQCRDGKCRQACSLPLISGADYSYCDFSGKTISGDLTDVSLQNANLRNVTITGSLRQANFDGADLTNANCSSPQLAAATFRKAKMQNATLTSALRNVNFDEADLVGARFTPAIMHDVSIVNANLMGATIQPAAITGPVSLELSFIDQFTWIEPIDPPVRPDQKVLLNFDYLISKNAKAPDWADATRFVLVNDDKSTYRHSFRDGEFQKISFQNSNMKGVNLAGTWVNWISLDGCTNTSGVRDQIYTGEGWLWNTYRETTWFWRDCIAWEDGDTECR